MITKDILAAVKGYTEKMKKPVTFVVQTGEHAKREELISFLSDIASVSDRLQVVERDTQGQLRSPISFFLEVDNETSGIEFSGIPGGHEFSSLILAMLHASGAELKLDTTLQSMVKNVSETLHFEVFISQSCHNCPDVVQTLNQFAVLNPHIRSEMIDGGAFQNIINEREIQGVPSVYLNGELFANGKVTPGELVAKLQERDASIAHISDAEALPLQDVTIIGGGPAGVSAAIYSARKGFKVTLIADRIGGQVKDTMGIENLISVPYTTGPELSGQLQAHMNEYDINVKEHIRVTDVVDDTIKRVTLSTGEVIQSKTLIISTGAKWRELGVPGEKENIGNGVAYCPHCDGPFYKGKDVAVIGGGNSGIEAALDLAAIVKHVTVFEFMPTLKADQVLIEKAEAKDNISILKNVASKEIKATNGKVSSIEYMERETEALHSLDLNAVFVQIGLLPNSQLVEDIVDRTQYGEIVINEKCETSATGVFACGDVTTVPFKQIVISMGEGSKAALSAFEYLMLHGEEIEQAYEQIEAQKVA